MLAFLEKEPPPITNRYSRCTGVIGYVIDFYKPIDNVGVKQIGQLIERGALVSLS